MSKPFYITTPLYYVNDEPHIGHAYTTVLADVLARYHRLFGDDVHFLTGTDEHGQKVDASAKKLGRTPQEHCDITTQAFVDVWAKLGIDYNDFIRTTQPRHKKVVNEILQQIYDAGDIYQKEYEGWYSVFEEQFFTDYICSWIDEFLEAVEKANPHQFYRTLIEQTRTFVAEERVHLSH